MSEQARTHGLDEALRLVVPALERHLNEPATGTLAGPSVPWRDALDTPVPVQGHGAERTLRALADTVLPDAMRMTAPGFNGWITTGATVVPAVARLAAAFAGTQRYLGHTTGLLESVALRWLGQVCSLAPELQGVFSSSGSVANVIAVAAARQAAYERLGVDPAKDGLAGLPAGRVYGSVEMHHCLLKAAGVLGLGRSGVVLVATDERQRVDVSALRRAVREDRDRGILPVAVVGVAGTTNTGAIDDLAGLADVAAEAGTWFHVDGAYGLFGRLDPRLTERYAAVDRADSVVVDAHKWLAVPTGIGATFVRDSAVLGRALTGEPSDYIEGTFAGPVEGASPWDEFGPPFHDWSLDLSAPARGMVVWAALHEIGLEGLRARVVADNDRARRVADLVRADERLELLGEPELSVCCFRYRAPGLDEIRLDAVNREVVRRLHLDTPYVSGGTLVGARYGVRPCYINPRTGDDEVTGLVAAVRDLGDRVASSTELFTSA